MIPPGMLGDLLVPPSWARMARFMALISPPGWRRLWLWMYRTHWYIEPDWHYSAFTGFMEQIHIGYKIDRNGHPYFWDWKVVRKDPHVNCKCGVDKPEETL